MLKFLIALIIVSGSMGHAGETDELKSLDGKRLPVPAMEAAVINIMEEARIPGLSCAIINDSKVVYRKTFGVKSSETGEPNDEDTVFAAASFSKTVFAYLVMLLVEEGALDLDKPLYQYLEQPLPDYQMYSDLEGDDRYKKITARMCLSHSTGFPNWRFLTENNRLQFLFDPGERHSYSGEGIALLQMVVEEVTGRGLEELAREKVFVPLGMTRTSYVWQETWEENAAVPHDQYQRPKRLNEKHEADAAGSMFTTAGDYARFLVAIMDAEGKRKATMDEMLRSQVTIGYRNMFGPGAWQNTDEYESIRLGWGLGWGRFDTEHGRAFFHTGHDIGWQNYTVTFVDAGIGVVLLSNSDNFESMARELAEATIGDRYSPFDWLGYPHYDPEANREPPPEPVAIDVDPAVLEMYTGMYQMTTLGKTLIVKLEEGQLFITDDEVQWTPLLAETETRFFLTEENYRFVFVKNSAGKVTHVNLEIGGIEIPGERVE